MVVLAVAVTYTSISCPCDQGMVSIPELRILPPERSSHYRCHVFFPPVGVLTSGRSSHYQSNEISLPGAFLTTRATSSHYRALFSLPEGGRALGMMLGKNKVFSIFCVPHVFWSLRTPARDSGPDQRGADYAGLFETCRSCNTPQIAIGTGSGTGSAQLQLQFRSGTRKLRELQP